MTPSDFVDELLRQLDWRLDEFNLLKNTLTFVKTEDARAALRKSAVVILYSHFEGFCVFALNHYITAINAERLVVSQVVSAIIAGAWEQVFRAMETGDQKCKIFTSKLPNDIGLHRHWRRRHFVEEIERLKALPVQISESTIDTESNLKSTVLQRNLFLLGLDHLFVEPRKDEIDNLLGRRNRIAHGEDRRGVNEIELSRYERAVWDICFRLIEFLEDGYANQRFKVTA